MMLKGRYTMRLVVLVGVLILTSASGVDAADSVPSDSKKTTPASYPICWHPKDLPNSSKRYGPRFLSWRGGFLEGKPLFGARAPTLGPW